MPDNKQNILVEILQGTQASSCSCGCSGCGSESACGSTPDYEDMVREMSVELIKQFGDQVEVKYVDIDKEGLDNYPIMGRVLQMGYPYPVTLINGEPKFAGGIMTSEVKQSIEEIMKN